MYYKFGKRIIKERQIPILNYKKIMINKTKDLVIFLEPHADDIALSISGVLYNLYTKGYNIKIINFFSYTPPKKSPWNRIFNFTEKDYEIIRKTENISAFKFFLNCELRSLNIKSSHYRDYRLFFQKPKKDDTAIPKIKKEFEKIKKEFPNAKIFVPAGIGNHVDHTLIRDLAIEYFNNLFFYEEYPYCTKKKYYNQAIKKLKKRGAKKIVEKININIKNNLINLYNSQLKKTFKENILEINNYFMNNGSYYEKYWNFQMREPKCFNIKK